MSGTICAGVVEMKCVTEVTNCAVYDLDKNGCCECLHHYKLENKKCIETLKVGIIVGIAVSVLVILGLIGGLSAYLIRRNKKASGVVHGSTTTNGV